MAGAIKNEVAPVPEEGSGWTPSQCVSAALAGFLFNPCKKECTLLPVKHAGSKSTAGGNREEGRGINKQSQNNVQQIPKHILT